MKTNAANILELMFERNYGFTKKAILLGIFGLFFFSLEAHWGNYTGGTCHYNHKEKKERKSKVLRMHCHRDDGKTNHPEKHIEIIKDYRNEEGKIVYREITYQATFDEKITIDNLEQDENEQDEKCERGGGFFDAHTKKKKPKLLEHYERQVVLEGQVLCLHVYKITLCEKPKGGDYCEEPR